MLVEETISNRIGSLIKLKPEFEERYIILHRHAFPGVLSQIKKVNIRNYSIFLLDGVLFSYYEYIGKNYSADMSLIANDVTKDWWKLTDPMQEPFEGRKEGEWWTEIDFVLSGADKYFSSTTAARFAFNAELISGKDAAAPLSLKMLGESIKNNSVLSGIQNVNLFLKGNKSYLYFESNRNDHADYLGLLNELTERESDSGKILCHSKNIFWNPMKEVFHTN